MKDASAAAVAELAAARCCFDDEAAGLGKDGAAAFAKAGLEALEALERNQRETRVRLTTAGNDSVPALREAG
ncbi:MAG: hypothetical protein EXQ97_01575 [Alphaproteobacteria bacterium]|nr:hypothetical protein [Alphaproteobacteria bacterium]